MKKAVAALLLMLCATGCYKATFIRDPNVQRGAQYDEWVSFFVFGLVGEQRIDVHQFCPDGRVAEIQTGANFGTGIVTALTLGIYAPRKVYVTCAANGRAMQLELDENGKLVAFAEMPR
jgi:Bor protein